MLFLDKRIKVCKKELRVLYAELSSEEEKNKTMDNEERIDFVKCKIREYIDNEYAKTVFDVYAPKKPKLIRILTGETVLWENAFGDDFEKIPKSRREALTGLIEGGSKYKLK